MLIFKFYFPFTGAEYTHVICAVDTALFVKLIQRLMMCVLEHMKKVMLKGYYAFPFHRQSVEQEEKF
jgi:hypothetical protein